MFGLVAVLQQPCSMLLNGLRTAWTRRVCSAPPHLGIAVGLSQLCACRWISQVLVSNSGLHSHSRLPEVDTMHNIEWMQRDGFRQTSYIQIRRRLALQENLGQGSAQPSGRPLLPVAPHLFSLTSTPNIIEFTSRSEFRPLIPPDIHTSMLTSALLSPHRPRHLALLNIL